jgi:hypothetical protein
MFLSFFQYILRLVTYSGYRFLFILGYLSPDTVFFAVHIGIVIHYFPFYIRMLIDGFSIINNYSIYFGRRVVLRHGTQRYLNIINRNI